MCPWINIYCRTHSSGEKPYACELCEKRFSFHQSLRNHHFLHSEKKLFKCEICNTSFRQIGHLQSHKLTHTGKISISMLKNVFFFFLNWRNVDKENQQPKIFSFFDWIGEKKFECKFCLKRFAMRGNLTVHMKMHMNPNDLPYQCSACPKKFNDLNDLKRHQLSHTAKAYFETSKIVQSHDNNNISAASESFVCVE